MKENQTQLHLAVAENSPCAFNGKHRPCVNHLLGNGGLHPPLFYISSLHSNLAHTATSMASQENVHVIAKGPPGLDFSS